MENTVLILTSVAATNIDSYNRSFKSDEDINNGAVFAIDELITDVAGEEEVFATKAAGASDLGLYMAFTAEDTVIEVGGQHYKFGLLDPRLYTNIAGKVFSGFRLVPGDRITLAGGIDGDKAAYVIVNSDGELEYAASTGDGLAFKVLKADYIVAAGAGEGAIGGTHRLDAVQLEVIQN